MTLTIIFLFFTFVFVRSFLMIVVVQGNSMFPLLTHGERVLVIRRHWPNCLLKTNQIIVFYPPTTSLKFSPDQTKTPYVKKLIGLAGDTIKIPATELSNELVAQISTEEDEDGNYTWVIPPAHCFVRGTAPVSGDSVIWGPVPLSSLIGIVLFKLPKR